MLKRLFYLKHSFCEDKEHISLELYLKDRTKRVFFGLFLLILVVILSFISIFTGSFDATFSAQIEALFNPTTSPLSYIVHNIRLPKTLNAIVCGASLGVAGAVMQTILKNPLASPFTLGVSQGAAFGATFAIIFLGGGSMYLAGNSVIKFDMPYLIALFAFLGGLLSSILILFLAMLKKVSPEALILAGVALSALFSALIMFMQYFASDVAVAATVFWTFGDLSKAGWNELYIMGFVVLVCIFYILLQRASFDTLLWGDEFASSKGLDVAKFRAKIMIISALMASVVTAFVGIIGFIGLIAPHIVRLFSGNNHGYLVPYSALCGANLLLFADILARSLLSPVILPVGIITSLFGAPLFLVLLLRRKA